MIKSVQVIYLHPLQERSFIVSFFFQEMALLQIGQHSAMFYILQM